MLDREGLIAQMARAFEGTPPLELAQTEPTAEARRRAAEALTRVELFLGAEIEEAKQILGRVLEDVS